jgi:hypothetical protein
MKSLPACPCLNYRWRKLELCVLPLFLTLWMAQGKSWLCHLLSCDSANIVLPLWVQFLHWQQVEPYEIAVCLGQKWPNISNFIWFNFIKGRACLLSKAPFISNVLDSSSSSCFSLFCPQQGQFTTTSLSDWGVLAVIATLRQVPLWISSCFCFL